jgi:molecular chaperone GrpE
MTKSDINEKEQKDESEDLDGMNLDKEEKEFLDSKPESSKPEEIDYKDRYMRLLAEYTNAMKQKEEELKSMAKFGNRNLLIKVLDVVDDIEIGLTQENLNEETKGILQILQAKVQHLLSLEGVAEMEISAGANYDSSHHEVLGTVPHEEHKGKIAHIARKGYVMGDRVLRTAKVLVGK